MGLYYLTFIDKKEKLICNKPHIYNLQRRKILLRPMKLHAPVLGYISTWMVVNSVL